MARRPSEESAPALQEGQPKVLYVMGAGRSGSTILGVTLGNCANVFFAGELDRWLVRSGVPTGKNVETAGFWRIVLADMGDFAEPELLGGKSSALERSSALLDIRRWPARRRLRAGYRRASETLYRTIAQVAGATHIVDSSHYPLRARELQALDGIELYLLYLMRDPRSVVASLARRDVRERTFGLFRANAYLWLTQALSLIVFLRQPSERRLFVRYEDFVGDPEQALGQLLSHCDCQAPLPDLTSLRTGTPFHGNRLIDSEVVSLEAPQSRSARGSRLTDLVQLPWVLVSSRLRPAVG